MSDTVVVGLDVGGTSTRATALTLDRRTPRHRPGRRRQPHQPRRRAGRRRTADRPARRRSPTSTRPGSAAGTIGLAGAGRLLADPAGTGRLRPGLARRRPALPVRGARRRPGRVRLRHRRPGRHGAHRRHRRDRRPGPRRCGWTGSPTATAGCSATRARASGWAGRRSAGSWPTWTGPRRRGAGHAGAHRTDRLRPRWPPAPGHRRRGGPGGHPPTAGGPGPARAAGGRRRRRRATRSPPGCIDRGRRAPGRERRPDPPAGATDPVVLGGGLLTGDTPLAAAVRAELARRWPAAPLRTAGDGAAAAAWLAARDLPEVTDPAALHARLVPHLRLTTPAPPPVRTHPRRLRSRRHPYRRKQRWRPSRDVPPVDVPTNLSA